MLARGVVSLLGVDGDGTAGGGAVSAATGAGVCAALRGVGLAGAMVPGAGRGDASVAVGALGAAVGRAAGAAFGVLLGTACDRVSEGARRAVLDAVLDAAIGALLDAPLDAPLDEALDEALDPPFASAGIDGIAAIGVGAEFVAAVSSDCTIATVSVACACAVPTALAPNVRAPSGSGRWAASCTRLCSHRSVAANAANESSTPSQTICRRDGLIDRAEAASGTATVCAARA
jgi:hypothetical protein